MKSKPGTDLLSSGFNEVVGFEISHWAENEVELSLLLQDKHLNRSNIVHGGVLATLLDVACGLAGCYCEVEGNVRRAVTLGLATNFVATTDSGTIITRASIKSSGFRIFFATGEVVDDRGRVLAIAQGDYQYVKGSELVSGSPVKDSR